MTVTSHLQTHAILPRYNYSTSLPTAKNDSFLFPEVAEWSANSRSFRSKLNPSTRTFGRFFFVCAVIARRLCRSQFSVHNIRRITASKCRTLVMLLHYLRTHWQPNRRITAFSSEICGWLWKHHWLWNQLTTDKLRFQLPTDLSVAKLSDFTNSIYIHSPLHAQFMIRYSRLYSVQFFISFRTLRSL